MRLSNLINDIPIINRWAFRFKIFAWDCERMDTYDTYSIPSEVLEYICNDIEFDIANNTCIIWLDKEIE